MNQGLRGWPTVLELPAGMIYVRRVTVGVDIATPAPSIVFSDIPQWGSQLRIRGQARGDTAATTVTMRYQFNGDSGSGQYVWHATGLTPPGSDTAITPGNAIAGTGTANFASGLEILVDNYSLQTGLFRTSIS